MSNITLNIVAPDTPTPTPVDPVVPSTGLFTHGIGSSEATIIAVSTILLLVIVALVVFAILHKKKTGKSLIRNNKHITTAVILLAILTSAGTFIALAHNAALAADTDEDTSDETGLTVDVSSTELTIELADQPVFAVLPVDITVEEATDLGYTLTAFAEDTNLVSTTDSSNIIPMVVSEDTPVALTANTYGLSFTDPESALDEVFTPLSTDSTTPTFITDKDYLATEANDTTTIYYGFYITPDTPYGTYTGSNISVDAIPNIATVTYNANGLYFNDSEEATENTVGYKPNIAEAPIELVTGEYLTPAPLTPVDPSTTIHYTFLGWSETEGATTPTYTNEEDILANLTLTKNESLTLYAVWHYDTVLSFNGTTSDGGVAIEGMIIPAGSTITLPQNTFTKQGSVFTGWNTAADGSGEAYADEAEFTAPDTSAEITLYAQWAYTTTITFNANGGTGSMSPQTVVAGTPQNLTKNAFTKTNATFIGWNTEANGSGTSYSDEAEYTASTEEHEDITLYAQWAYTTISFNGNTSDSGTMNPITIAGGTTSNLPAKAFTKNNCIFTGWNTEANGTGISYGDSTPYTANATTIEAFTLYAQWQCISQVNYYGNGATSGGMASNIVLGGSTLTFSQNAYTKDGYAFNGWNTKADGTGTSYSDQGTFTAPMTPATTLNLYAQWAGTTITFSSNGGSGTMSDVTIPAGTSANLPQNTFTRTGYAFNGWNTNVSGTGTSYSDQGSYYATAGINTTITLHAQWLPTTTITFNGNDATSGTMSDQVIVAGTPQNLSANTYTKEGYVFNGWNTVQTPTTENPGTVYADKTQYTASTIAAENVTLYAQWEVPLLYNYVAKMSKGTQDAAALQADITAPTTDDPATDTSNSGVYEYNATVFGEASDASNTNKIYYYRGILEQVADQGEYGSDGKATTYPNYVRLGNDTCWRIVRTTGSGGVKMVYNGTWTGSTCAKNQNNAQLTTSSFNSSYSSIVYAGYTYNSSYTNNSATNGISIDTVLGNNSNLALNNTRSTIKTYIEDTWYANNMTAYTNKLESVAGYCNDRTLYNNDHSQQLSNVDTSQNNRFGASYRVGYNSPVKAPSLTCPRGDVDNYRYVANSNGTANELKYPAALLTADEVTLAGSGYNTVLPYNAKSFLRSGKVFWSLSPDYRSSNGGVCGFALNPGGTLDLSYVGGTYGVRPAISLKPGTTVADGEGTATNPWTIDE